VGIITDRDVCMAACTSGKSLRELPVEEAMSRELWSVTEHDSLGAAEALMQKKGVRRLPVLDADRRLVGIISLHDLAKEAVRQKSAIVHQVSDEEVGRTLAGICERSSSRGTASAESNQEPTAERPARGGDR